MPKFDWDAFLGGVAKSGLEGYQIAATASTAKGELDRRKDVDAFNMGAATPIIRMGGVGGLGGMAKNQIDQSAGLNPEDPIDYQAYNTPGAIGAAPAFEAAPGPVGQASGGGAGPQGQPSGGLGDGASRAAAGGATAQARPSTSSPTDEEAVGFLSRLDARRRKIAMEGVAAADVESQKKEAGVYLTELGNSLATFRTIKQGVEASERIIQIRQNQLQQLVGVEQTLMEQQSNAPSEEQAGILQQINKNRILMDTYKAEIQTQYKRLENVSDKAEMAHAEAVRKSKALEMLGVQPELIENFRKTYMEDGNIGQAGKLLLYGFGQGMVGKKPTATQAPRSARPQSRPLR